MKMVKIKIKRVRINQEINDRIGMGISNDNMFESGIDELWLKVFSS